MILHIPKKGRCVFADQHYKKNDTIEICEYIVVPQDQIEILKKTVLNNYRFGKDDDACILLGNGSLYNHSKKPNMQVMADNDDRIGFVALRNIEQGEELTFDYGYKIDFPYVGDTKIVAKVKA